MLFQHCLRPERPLGPISPVIRNNVHQFDPDEGPDYFKLLA